MFFCTEEQSPCIKSFKETYGFKSRFTPKLINVLKVFENDMLNLAKDFKNIHGNDKFQQKKKPT